MSVTAVTDATFVDEVLQSPLPVLVDFWADWCVPCKQLAPIVEELSEAYAGRVKFTSVDTNENPGAMADNDIRSLPTIHIFSNGILVETLIGSVTKMKLRQVLDAL